MPDRFSEEEARRIFARAAERQHTETAKPPGLSLAELQEIGRASGIDPVHIAAAVSEVKGGLPGPEPVTFFGVDMEPRATRVIAGDITEDEWVQVVSRLRRQFGAKGIPSTFGRVREWTSGADSNLHVMAEPVDGGTRITLETSKAHEVRGTKAASVMMAVVLVAMSVGSLITGDPTLFAAGATVTAAVAVAFGAMALVYRSWSAQRSREFAALLDQIELISRSAEALSRSPHPDDATLAPRLDLDALDEASDAPSQTNRQRTRS